MYNQRFEGHIKNMSCSLEDGMSSLSIVSEDDRNYMYRKIGNRYQQIFWECEKGDWSYMEIRSNALNTPALQDTLDNENSARSSDVLNSVFYNNFDLEKKHKTNETTNKTKLILNMKIKLPFHIQHVKGIVISKNTKDNEKIKNTETLYVMKNEYLKFPIILSTELDESELFSMLKTEREKEGKNLTDSKRPKNETCSCECKIDDVKNQMFRIFNVQTSTCADVSSSSPTITDLTVEQADFTIDHMLQIVGKYKIYTRREDMNEEIRSKMSKSYPQEGIKFNLKEDKDGTISKYYSTYLTNVIETMTVSNNVMELLNTIFTFPNPILKKEAKSLLKDLLDKYKLPEILCEIFLRFQPNILLTDKATNKSVWFKGGEHSFFTWVVEGCVIKIYTFDLTRLTIDDIKILGKSNYKSSLQERYECLTNNSR